jgi:glyoxylase-like metal-dependent hydrolase (beta-lactamase superfamily II)
VEGGDRAPEGVVRVRADNPSPMTLEGTNTYVAGGWVIDPGPADDGHLDAVLAAAPGGIEGIVLTHGHPDHEDGAAPLAERAGGVPVVRPADGDQVGPLTAVATPGHSRDHVCLMLGRACFTGDLILGTGSAFVGSDGASMSDYMRSLERVRELDPEVLCPGHGPFVWEARAKVDEYIAHRLDRERRVVEALEAGVRDRDAILRRAWSEIDLDAVPMLRWAAGATLDAHLAKLRDEGRLPGELG